MRARLRIRNIMSTLASDERPPKSMQGSFVQWRNVCAFVRTHIFWPRIVDFCVWFIYLFICVFMYMYMYLSKYACVYMPITVV